MTTNEFSLRAAAALACCAGTLATASTSWGQATFSNVNPIEFNDSNASDGDNEPASPYPSVIPVAGLQGEIAKITVRVNALTHNAIDDVNLLLRSPEGTSVYLMGDVGTIDGPVSNVWLTFDDRAANALSLGVAFGTGRYRPTLAGDTEIFPAPAPAGPHQSTLSSLIGEDPNGNWRLFVIDDSGPNPAANEIVGSWAVEITTGFTFRSDDGPIAIPESSTQSAADVYPSRITVSGLPNTMEDCFVTLEGLNHGWIADMHVVVRSPNGRTVTLLNSTLGSADFTDATVVFEDSSLLLPAAGAGGYYLPINGNAAENLPAPGPAGPYGVHLGRFSGVDPNGEWRLFCADQVPGDGDGTLESWSITFLYPTSSFSSGGGGGTCPGDADGDNDVDFNDLNLVLDNFAEVCLP